MGEVKKCFLLRWHQFGFCADDSTVVRDVSDGDDDDDDGDGEALEMTIKKMNF